MLKFFQRPKMFMKCNASTILTFIGAGGVVATSVLAVKATPKAMKSLKYAEREKREKLTLLETVCVAGPAYIPAVVAGASTIGCIFGANVLNKRQQAALASAYALLDHSYKQYRSKVAELYGDDGDIRIRSEIAKDEYATTDIVRHAETQLFYDITSMRYFESTPEAVQKAEDELNKQLLTTGYACLNDFYSLLGLAEAEYGNRLGWTTYDRGRLGGCDQIDFSHDLAVMDDGLECRMLHIITEPTLDYQDY